MYPKNKLEKNKKKGLIFFIVQIHFLVFLLIGVLWVRSQFKEKLSKSSSSKSLERKAQFFLPDHKSSK